MEVVSVYNFVGHVFIDSILSPLTSDWDAWNSCNQELILRVVTIDLGLQGLYLVDGYKIQFSVHFSYNVLVPPFSLMSLSNIRSGENGLNEEPMETYLTIKALYK